RRRLSKPDIDDARVHDGAHIVDVDVQNARHARQTDEYAASGWNGATREARPRATRRIRHAHSVTQLDNPADFVRGQRKHDGERAMLVDRAVVLVEHQVVVAPQDSVLWEELAQLLDDGLLGNCHAL